MDNKQLMGYANDGYGHGDSDLITAYGVYVYSVAGSLPDYAEVYESEEDAVLGVIGLLWDEDGATVAYDLGAYGYFALPHGGYVEVAELTLTAQELADSLEY